MARSRTDQTVDRPAASAGRSGPGQPESPSTGASFFQRRHRRAPLLAAGLAALAGVVNLISSVTPELAGRARDLSDVLPGAVSRSASAVTAAVGLLLLLLARALRRRKRRAWRAAVVLLGVSVVTHVVKGLDVEESVVSGLLLVVLVLLRRDFYAKGDPTTRWRALRVGLGLLAGSVLLGLVLLRIQQSHIVPPHPLSAQLSEVLRGLVGLNGPLHFSREATDDLVYRVLGVLGLLTALTVVYLALRPPAPLPLLTESDEQRMRALLAGRHGGRDSLGYFALRRDKSVVWSPSGKACIAYRVVSGVMLGSGDPLGDPEAWPGAISEFLREADEHAWTPAVIGCSEAGGKAFDRAGLAAFEFGDEAVVDLTSFSLEGRAMRNVRQAAGRPQRAGYTTQVRRIRDIAAEEGLRLREQAAAWRNSETERGFSMALGRMGDPRDGDCVAVTAFDETGGLRGFLHFVPWGPDGLSLDLMRRDSTAENGINEFLIVAALQEAPGLGVRRVSLNFAVFRAAIERGERLGAGPVLRAWRGTLVFLSRWFQIDSLYRFNAKFRPDWEPRFICYPAARDLPRIAIAMLEAEAFIVWPRPRLRGPLRVLTHRTSAETS